MLINYNSNYDPSAPWAEGIRSIGSIMATMPAIRAMAAQRQAMAENQRAHAGYEQAATGEAGARAGLLTAQTQSISDENSGHLQFASALKKLALNPNDTDALGDAFEGAGKGFKTDPENTTKAMGILLSQIVARNGSTNFAQMGALQGGATSIANNQADNAARAALPANNQATLPAGSTLVDRLKGTPVAQAAATIPVGGTRLAPAVGDAVPTVEAVGTPEPPKSSAQDAAMAQLMKDYILKQVAPGANDTAPTNSVVNVANLFKQATGGQPVTPTVVNPAPFPLPANGINGAAAQVSAPQPQHIQYLLQHPDTAAMFDAKFGQGASAAILKQAQTPAANGQ